MIKGNIYLCQYHTSLSYCLKIITLQHEISKQHYITFAAYVTCDKVLLIKLYPEQSAEIRFPGMYGGEFYICSNKHGLIKKT